MNQPQPPTLHSEALSHKRKRGDEALEALEMRSPIARAFHGGATRAAKRPRITTRTVLVPKKDIQPHMNVMRPSPTVKPEQPKPVTESANTGNKKEKENDPKASGNSEPLKVAKKMTGKSDGSKPASSITGSTKDKELSKQGGLNATTSKSGSVKPSKSVTGKSGPLKPGSPSPHSTNNKEPSKKGQPQPQAPGRAKKTETPTTSKSRKGRTGRAKKEDEAKVKKQPIRPRTTYEQLEREMRELHQKIKNAVSELQRSGEKTLSSNPSHRPRNMSEAKKKAEAFLKHIEAFKMVDGDEE